jgi:FtsZ-binding cell division protein ZapB
MGATLTLSILEIILLFFGAIILGITIHFTIASRRNLKSSMNQNEEVNKARDEWKQRYFNDVELKDKELFSLKEQLSGFNTQLSDMKEQLAEAEENSTIYTIEAEEMRKENKKLLAEMNKMQMEQKVIPYAEKIKKPETTESYESHESPESPEKQDYLEQLRRAQSNLLEHNEKIDQLLGNIDALKEVEEKQREMTRRNEELSLQVSELRMKLSEKEAEMNNVRQKEHLTKEMTSMLDNAYNEFNVLQGKMQKLELQVSSSKMINMEYEDLKESFQKMSRDCEEQKLKLGVLFSENQSLQGQLAGVEDKLREANFQRQQLQKKCAYLEELSNDMHAVSDANKKLEGQLKRIGELESMLNMVAEERDQVIRREDK